MLHQNPFFSGTVNFPQIKRLFHSDLKVLYLSDNGSPPLITIPRKTKPYTMRVVV